MKTRYLPCWVVGGILLIASSATQAVVSGDLLTNSHQTTPWLDCDGSALIAGAEDKFDATHLQGEGCVFRTTPATAGSPYTMTCGVSSLKYSSITLAFQNDNGETLATQTTEIFEDTNGGAYSVHLTAPAGTTTAAVGIYGLAGTGFQDCTLLLDDGGSGPVDGSISGTTWFDANGNSVFDGDERPIAGTNALLYLNGVLIDQTTTDSLGVYYFGGLDLDQCYQVQLIPADPTLTFAAAGGGNQISVDGYSSDLCPNSDMPNVSGVNAGFVAIPPVTQPEDYAVCGRTLLANSSEDDFLSGINVTLINAVTSDRYKTTSGSNGQFIFSSLPAGNYTVNFQGPAGFEFLNTGSVAGFYADANGNTPQFNLPDDSNTSASAACTINNIYANLAALEVALEPTFANDDVITGVQGTTFTSMILANDAPCGGSTAAVDIIGHTVPGNVSFDIATGALTISNTTGHGTYSVQYGLRGACGSYDTATVRVVIEEVPVPPEPTAPNPPARCVISINSLFSEDPGKHVDIVLGEGQTHADLAPQYDFAGWFDIHLYTGLAHEATQTETGYRWSKLTHGAEVVLMTSVVAVGSDGLKSSRVKCAVGSITPIALDTDLNGEFETLQGDFQFDMDADGTAENLIDWFGPSEGILIKKTYGKAISGEHLFGDMLGKYKDGYAKLALEDVNSDGQVAGDELSSLAIWTDRNSNAKLDQGELSSLDSHGINSLSVEHYKYSARATLENGKTMLMRDLFFGLEAIMQSSR